MRTRPPFSINVQLALVAVACMGGLSGCDAGCGRAIPGDGTLAIVEYDDAFDANLVPDGRKEGDAVREAIHFWNVLGANLRTVDEVSAAVAQAAPHFSIARSTFSWPGLSSAPIGTESSVLGSATIYVKAIAPFTYFTLRQDVAHELGHAIGLAHVDGRGIMAADRNDNNAEPSPADIVEYRRHY